MMGKEAQAQGLISTGCGVGQETGARKVAQQRGSVRKHTGCSRKTQGKRSTHDPTKEAERQQGSWGKTCTNS